MICHRAHLAADDHPTVPALRFLDVEAAVANECLDLQRWMMPYG